MVREVTKNNANLTKIGSAVTSLTFLVTSLSLIVIRNFTVNCRMANHIFQKKR